MKSIETNLTITEDGQAILKALPEDLEPGEYQVVILLSEQQEKTAKNGKAKEAKKRADSKLSPEELAELMEAVAETEARLAAGWTPTPEELKEAETPYEPDPEELAGVLEAIAEEQGQEFRPNAEEVKQRIFQRIANYNPQED